MLEVIKEERTYRFCQDSAPPSTPDSQRSHQRIRESCQIRFFRLVRVAGYNTKEKREKRDLSKRRIFIFSLRRQFGVERTSIKVRRSKATVAKTTASIGCNWLVRGVGRGRNHRFAEGTPRMMVQNCLLPLENGQFGA